MKKMLKYQMSDLLKGIIIYFGLLILLLCIGLFLPYIIASSEINLNGFGFSNGFSNYVFTFAIGIAIYKEHYFMAMQNGISRISFYKSTLCSLAILSFTCSIFDTLLVIIGNFSSFNIDNIILLLYSNFFNNKGIFITIIINFIFTFIITFTFAISGLLISSIFFRLSKKYRMIFVFMICIFFFCILPLSFVFFYKFWKEIFKLIYILMGFYNETTNPLMGCLTLSITFIILSGFSYIMLRKTEV